jgi:ABC-type amino acid transport substrate-binding protein
VANTEVNMHILAKMKYSISLFFVASVLFSGSSWSQIKFQFASIENLVEQEIAAKMIVPIFKSAGFDIEIVPMPGERARVKAVRGSLDGDLSRILSFGENNPSLIRVPTPYSSVETVAFALKSKNISIETKEDLGKHKLVIVRGVQTTKDLTKEMPNVKVLNSLKQVVRFVQADRGDIFITSDIAAFAMLKRLKTTSFAPIFEISSLPLYVYFNPKHKDVVPKIDRAIQEKARTGELKKMRALYENQAINGID